MPIGLVAPLHLATCHRVASLPCIINEQEYNEIKAVEAAFQLRIELEADENLDISHEGGGPSWQKICVPSNLNSPPSRCPDPLPLTLCWLSPAPFSFHQTRLLCQVPAWLLGTDLSLAHPLIRCQILLRSLRFAATN